MHTAVMENQTKKTEIWPIAIIGALVVFGGLVITAVVIMFDSPQDMVTENYYEKELAYQSQIDKAAHTLNLKKQPQVLFDETGEQLILDFPVFEENISKVEGKVNFFRPSDESLDFNETLSLNEEGQFFIPLEKLAKGAWNIKIEWKEAGTEFFYETRIEKE